MTYTETIEGPWGPTTGSPLGTRLAWTVKTGRLYGEWIDASVVTPGMDWIRLGDDGIRRQDLRVTLETTDGEIILFSYDNALIRADEAFTTALTNGEATDFDAQYMRMVPRFDTGAEQYSWLTQNLFVGEGRLAGPKAIEYRIYRIT
jgi:hypothetical protein